MDCHSEVREANKLIYDQLGDSYESIDGRRSKDLSLWLKKKLYELSRITPSRERLLDVGCGTGFVANAARGIFLKLYGLDISEKILQPLSKRDVYPVCADATEFPFKDECMDVVILFAVMHHFYDFRPILREAHRVLKPGGIIYIDHDMNRNFFKSFKFFINFYRRLSGKERIFRKRGMEKLYRLSEYYSDGIDFDEVKHCLEQLRFRIRVSYHHWYGVSKLVSAVLGEKRLPKWIAPLSALIAQK